MGIQLLLWVLGGLYFAWTDLDQIHGDDLRVWPKPLVLRGEWVSPTQAAVRGGVGDHFSSLDVVDVLGNLYYRFEKEDEEGQTQLVLVATDTGEPRAAVNQSEAETIARADFSPTGRIAQSRLLQQGDVGRHHEYRGGPLPVWRVDFEHSSQTRIYISAADGQIRARRNGRWRIFDFLWMLHTMDFWGRDNINNPILRGVSLLALVTVGSGFALWWATKRR